MAKVQISCPSCSKFGYIEIAEDLINKSMRGLLAVNIAEETICSHTFIVYIDKNLIIRDYFMADFKIELPKIEIPESINKKGIPAKDVLNIDLIKLNLPGILITYVFKSIFSKQKTVIISNQEFLFEHIRNFFKYITQETINSDILVCSKEEFNKNKKKYKDYIILQGNQILRDDNKVLNPKKMKIEKQLVQEFLSENDLAYSYIMLKNEISKIFLLGKDVADYINHLPQSEQKKLSIFDLSKHITDYATIHKIKIHREYLDFLVDLVINYFEIKISKQADAKDFLTFL
ncbi:MAG: hypothetical protein ACFFAH_10865 [Promethearchaeota archaeon]